MISRTPKSRHTVWISVSLAAGLIFYYYYSSRSPVGSSPAPATDATVETGAPFSSRHAATTAPGLVSVRDVAPRAAASAPKLAVKGVMITPASRAALISVDDRPATLYVEGQQVADGVVLYALSPGGIVVKRGDELLRLPLRGVQSAGSADAVQSGGGADAVQSAEGTDASRFVRSPDPVQSAESAGVELPAWATESVLSGPPSAAEARRAARHHD